jgi:translation initiation factor 1A|tara:strand:+ start:4025 stop:4594 length:570 start_codon:yes stop_codon:yes gene_type:complete
MVFNTGGNKSKRGARKNFRKKTYSLNDLRPSSDDNQQYGYVTDKYGDGRFQVLCYDKVSRLAIVRGAIKKKTRLVSGGFVLLSMRDFEDAKCDIVYVYTDDDTDKLIKNGAVEESFAKDGKLSLEKHDSNMDEGGEVGRNLKPMSDIKSYGSDNEVWADDDDTQINTTPVTVNTSASDMDLEEIDIDDI